MASPPAARGFADELLRVEAWTRWTLCRRTRRRRLITERSPSAIEVGVAPREES